MLELVIFICATILFFAGKYFITDPAYVRIMTAAYVMVVLISQFYFNVALLSSICVGTSNLGMAVIATLLPWIVIFGSVYAALIIFPGWKQPFSNTFGYGIAKLMGVNSILFSLLKSESVGDTQTKKILHNIYTNPALFINQITPESFDDFVKSSKFMFVPGATSKPEMKQLRNIIRMKDLVSEFMWYVLSGILVTTVSYNTIVNTNCSNSVQEMKKRHNEYEADVKKSQEAAKIDKPPRIYYIRD